MSATGPAPGAGAREAPADALGTFDEAAHAFAALAPTLWDRLAAATLAALDPCPGEKVLDACCGTGASALPTAERVGPTGGMDAVDLAEPMLDLLRAEAARRDLSYPMSRIAEAVPYAERLRCLGLVDVDVRTAWLRLHLDPDLVWLLVTGSGRGMLSGLSPDEVEQVRGRLVARLDGAVLDATSLVGTGTAVGG